MVTCSRGHEIQGPQDRLGDGQCKTCHAENQAKYAQRRKAGVALLHAAEGRGMTVWQALCLIRHAPYWTWQECQTIAKSGG